MDGQLAQVTHLCLFTLSPPPTNQPTYLPFHRPIPNVVEEQRVAALLDHFVEPPDVPHLGSLLGRKPLMLSNGRVADPNERLRVETAVCRTPFERVEERDERAHEAPRDEHRGGADVRVAARFLEPADRVVGVLVLIARPLGEEGEGGGGGDIVMFRGAAEREDGSGAQAADSSSPPTSPATPPAPTHMDTRAPRTAKPS